MNGLLTLSLDMMMNEDPVKQIVMDLVQLAIRVNNVVIQGQFPGAISDEVNALLKMCQEINNEYVVPDGPDNNVGESVSGECDRCGFLPDRCCCGNCTPKV